MQNILERIVEIDRQAQEKKQAALQNKAQTLAQVEPRVTAVREQYRQRAKEKLEQIKAQRSGAAKAALEQIEREKAEQLAALQRLYDQENARWTDEICHRILEEDR